MFFLSLLFVASFAMATPENSTGKLVQYLAEEKSNLNALNNEAKLSLGESINQEHLALQKQQCKAMLSLVHAKIDDLNNFLANQRKQQQSLTYRLKKLQQSPLTNADAMEAQEQISAMTILNEANNKTIELIIDNLSLANRYQAVLLAKNRQLDLFQAQIDVQQRLDELNKQINGLDEVRNHLFESNVELQQDQKLNPSFDSNLSTQAKLLLNNQDITLVQYQITELELHKRRINADYLLFKNQDIKTLQSVTDVYANSIKQLSTIETSLEKILRLLAGVKPVVTEAGLGSRYLEIKTAVSSHLSDLMHQQVVIQQGFEHKQQQLKKQLSMRQSLAEYHLETWPSIVNQLLLMPAKCYDYIKSLMIKIGDNYVWQESWSLMLYWACFGLVLVVAYALNRLLRGVVQDKERSRMSAHLYDGLLVMLYRNLPHLTIITIVVLTCFLNHLAFANYQLLVNILIVWLMFRNLIMLARLVLLESITDASGQDVRLYYRLKWLLLAGGWTTGLMVFSHQLPLSLLLQDIFNRLFMLFLLSISWVLWKSRDVIPYLLRPLLITKKRYFRNAIALFSVVVPLIILTTAIIGLVGYINLAWTMSRYQAYLLLLITAYVLARGLVFDGLELLSEWMISSLKNGWLWIEVILKPLDLLLRLVLFLVSMIILFQVFGWYSDSFVMGSLKTFGHYPLVDISGVHITCVSILEFAMLLCIFMWASKWTREFCYRWLYRNTRDAGIRNSLSVFTQYAVILMGVFITLRVLGLDFSGMSMVLGGLAVGMGFGLRDFASNIVGGLMLLIERPVREGDLITLGEYEGRVAHIGIRSMRVSSWDNMEVLIPNAETFNKPFTNWTHQDSIVRTVVPIKVSRADDPTMIQQLILDVLSIIPEILSAPVPQVFLKQIDDALIEFEVRYFINVQLYTRFEIRSKVLFAITAQFNAAGVRPPIPPLSVELKSAKLDNSDYANSSKSSQD